VGRYYPREEGTKIKLFITEIKIMIKYKIKSIHQRSKGRQKWIVHSFWTLKEIKEFLKTHQNVAGTIKKGTIQYQNIEIKLKSPKNLLFLNNHHSCKICKIPITYAVLEKVHPDIKTYHFNYYTIDSRSKKEILFNIDHIVPKSKGGSDLITNLQLTCELCNTEKGNKFSKFQHWWNKTKKLLGSIIK